LMVSFKVIVEALAAQKRKKAILEEAESEVEVEVEAKPKKAKNKQVAEGELEALEDEGEAEKPSKKEKKQKKAQALEEAVEEAQEEAPARVKKEKKQKKAKATEEAPEEVQQEAPAADKTLKTKKRSKEAAVEAEAPQEEAQEEAIEEQKPTQDKRQKKATDAEAEVEEAPVQKEEQPTEEKKQEAVEEAPTEAPAEEEILTVFIGGLPFKVKEAQLRLDFSECGEIEKLLMPTGDDGKRKGIAFITFKTKEAVKRALEFNGDEYGGRSLTVALGKSITKDSKPEKGKGKGDKGKGKGEKGAGKNQGKGEKGAGKSKSETKVYVSALPFSVDEEAIKKVFEECGEVESVNMPRNEEGKGKGIAFIEFKDKGSIAAALKKEGSKFGGRTIHVNMAVLREDQNNTNDKGKGKGSQGKRSEEPGQAKQTFGDSSDDDEGPPAKGAKGS